MTKLGGVAINVNKPILLANAKGISKRLALRLALAAKLTTIGSIKATVPVLLTKPPMPAVTNITNRKRRVSLFPANFKMRELIILAKPVWKMAPPTTNSPTIIITTELEKPDKASAGVKIWKTRRAHNAHNATMSERTLPLANKAAEMTRIAIVIHINSS